jgi:hypothetical protein
MEGYDGCRVLGATGGCGLCRSGSVRRAGLGGGRLGDRPQDQLALVHKNEMVLPVPLAERVRDMTAGTRGGDIHIHTGGNSFSATDAAGMDRLMRQHEKAIVRTIARLHRNGSFRV